MALVNPNIALSTRLPEFQPRNALAEYAQLQQIQGGQQAQELARFQMAAAKRAEEATSVQNELMAKHFDPAKGGVNINALVAEAAQRGQGGIIPGLLKTETERQSAAATLKKTQGDIEKNQFDLQNKKFNKAWQNAGSAATPQIAIEQLTKAVRNGEIDMTTATREIQNLQNMPPEQYREWRANKILALMDAKDQLGFILPKNTRQDIGGQIVQIQDNPMMAGYGQPIAGAAITKTPTIGERTAQGQLNLAQQKFAFEKNNPGFELQQTEDGSFIGVNKRTLQAFPVTMGGAAPTPAAAPTAPGAGMPGPRLPAPATQVIPGMTSVLDQPAAVAAVAPGSPVKGSPKNKDISVSEQQASYNIARVLNAADEIGKITKKDPKALAPGGMEAALKSTGLEGAANLARSTNRQIVNGAQRDALDALLYLATGAAYNKEQLQGAFEAYIPSYTDDTGTREAKQARMTSLINDAKVRAGKAWTPKMDAAMTSLTGSTGPAAAANIPAPKGVDSSLWNVMTPEERKLWQPK
jgi:hypothetical protein